MESIRLPEAPPRLPADYINEQPSEGSVEGAGYELDVQEVFYTLQGEGPLAGRRAVFVRLAGCNMSYRCLLCDTDYTSKRRKLSTFDVARQIVAAGPRGCLVVLTGGEPLRQPLDLLIRELLLAQHPIQIETNGTLYQDLPSDSRITVVCSPKAPAVNSRLAPYIDYYKYVVEAGKVDPADGLPTFVLGQPCRAARPPAPWLPSKVYVSPCDSFDSQVNEANAREAVKSCLTFGYTLSVQAHKIVGLP